MPDIDPNLPGTGTGNPQPGGTNRFYTQEELDAERERVRQQERDKLYPQISKSDERWTALNDELKDLRKSQKASEKLETDRVAAIEAEKKRAAEAEMSAKDLIDRRQAEFDARMAQFQAEQDLKIAILEKQNEATALQAYIQRRINEEQDNIAPELLEFIAGNTPEDVEASIAKVKATTTSIAENMRSAGVRQRAGMPGVAPAAGTNGFGPLDQPGSRELSAEDVKGMGMQEFAALRAKLGMAGSNNQGLFRT